ncbi:MAG: flagellar motor protein MotB [Janthinobacterium lividum]
MSDETHPHEIIIIKRRGGHDEEGHHGGVWKIAYADFVTAMMAFFLVMWLLSANEKTKASLVKYFNPIQLVDTTPQPPGLGDPNEKLPDPKKGTGKPAPEKQAKAGSVKDSENRDAAKDSEARDAGAKRAEATQDDKALFKDPYAALNEIGLKDAPPSRGGLKAPTDGSKGGAGSAGAAQGLGGNAYRDPFDPVSVTSMGSVEGAADSGRSDSTAPTAAPPASMGSIPTPGDDPVPLPADSKVPTDPVARAADLKKSIDAIVKSAASGPGPKIDVKATSEGLLIGLTDDAKFSMFASASAEPSPRAVTLLEKVGRLLKTQRGHVVLRGYTDGRKYRSDTYDNWRLSSARADIAHYMLVRGGLDDARFERIEGYADRLPRNAKDPEAPENRRIEILLRDAP